jgi:hypothetical protein
MSVGSYKWTTQIAKVNGEGEDINASKNECVILHLYWGLFEGEKFVNHFIITCIMKTITDGSTA